MYFNIPSGLTIDTAEVLDTTGQQHNFGTICFVDNSTDLSWTGTVVYRGTTEVKFRGGGAILGDWDTDAPATIGSGDNFAIQFRVPITGWKK
jgi:hypothetical protein